MTRKDELSGEGIRTWAACRSSLLSQMRPPVFRARRAGGAQWPPGAVIAAQAAGALPHRVPALEIPPDGHAQAGAAAAPRLLGELKRDVGQRHDVVLADRALLFVTEHAVEVSRVQDFEGAGRVGRGPCELGVVVGDERSIR